MANYGGQHDLVPIDSRIQVTTPENIGFQYRIAGPMRRLPAYAIDLTIRFLAGVVLAIVLGFTLGWVGLRGVSVGVWLVSWFALSWFYGGLFETLWNGQTPGKRLMGLRVLTDNGQPIDALQAILRNVLRAVDAFPVVPWPGSELPLPILPLYQVGLVVPMLNERFQRLGDLACGTIVVVEDSQRVYGIVRVTEPEALRLAALLPAKVEISRSLGRALAQYVNRRTLFAWGRRTEIARHLGELMRVHYGLPPGTNPDMLLCAVYYRAFIADRVEDDPAPVRRGAASRPSRSREHVGSRTGGEVGASPFEEASLREAQR